MTDPRFTHRDGTPFTDQERRDVLYATEVLLTAVLTLEAEDKDDDDEVNPAAALAALAREVITDPDTLASVVAGLESMPTCTAGQLRERHRKGLERIAAGQDLDGTPII